MKTEMKVPNEPFFPTDVFLISCGMGCKRITVSDIAYIEAMWISPFLPKLFQGFGHFYP